MKKHVATFLALLMILCLCGCQNTKGKNEAIAKESIKKELAPIEQTYKISIDVSNIYYFENKEKNKSYYTDVKFQSDGFEKLSDSDKIDVLNAIYETKFKDVNEVPITFHITSKRVMNDCYNLNFDREGGTKYLVLEGKNGSSNSYEELYRKASGSYKVSEPTTETQPSQNTSDTNSSVYGTCTICGKKATHTFQGSHYCTSHYNDAVKWAIDHQREDKD